ncbi:MAG: entericidin A/B family lipoprotein [Rhodocyclaceae bacterium]|jgi:entericidin B|nr:entericidin A/B family lipoprotein [Rhodocyclaceae bacterium]MBK6906857.1 entericidin A/B family lipoprotein [Rhodocyclaceae bacterium]
MAVTKYLVIFASVLVLVGCNTVEGVGKDIKKAGTAIEKAAQ